MMMRLTHFTLLSAVLILTLSPVSLAWAPLPRPATVTSSTRTLQSQPRPHSLALYSTKEKPAATTTTSSIDETTKKYGLEAGLMKSLQQKDGGESAKSLLKKYGIAYLATSIPLAIVSFAICYWLVDQGVDVGALLAKVGIETSSSSGSTTGSTAETAGTLAIAYAAHKAASPIRFPPTVLLTPVVAKWIGKEPVLEEGEEEP